MEAQCVERVFVDSPLSAKVALFNQQANSHQQRQSVNPFSNGNCLGSMPRPQFSKDEYGRPGKGTLSASRGYQATLQVCKDMLECCDIIYQYGELLPSDKQHDPRVVITFGALFTLYTVISDKLVGLLLRARKHKLLEFEGEVLFQRRDDDVPIYLVKPIAEIRKTLNTMMDAARESLRQNELYAEENGMH